MIVLITVFIAVDILAHRRPEIVKHDVPWSIVFQYYLYLIPTVLQEYQVAPMALLISTLLVLGASAQRNEFIAMLAGGIGLARIARVPVAIALTLSLLMLLVGETIGPIASRRADEIVEHYFARNPEGARAGITWAHLPGDWTCHVMKFNRVALTGETVIMLAIHHDTIEQIRADRIFWDETTADWKIEDGTWSVFYPDRGMEVNTRRISQVVAPIPETPAELFALGRHASTFSATELRGAIRYGQKRGTPTTRAQVEFHRKFAGAALSFVMVWLAIPFAIRVRKGGLAIGFGISIAIGIAYLVVYAAAVSMGYVGRLSPPMAAWLANVLFMTVGLILFRRSPT